MAILDEILARPPRPTILAKVSAHLVHGSAHAHHPFADHDGDCHEDCLVTVIALATGGTARSLVRCLFTADTAHVPAAAVRL